LKGIPYLASPLQFISTARPLSINRILYKAQKDLKLRCISFILNFMLIQFSICVINNIHLNVRMNGNRREVKQNERDRNMRRRSRRGKKLEVKKLKQ